MLKCVSMCFCACILRWFLPRCLLACWSAGADDANWAGMRRWRTGWTLPLTRRGRPGTGTWRWACNWWARTRCGWAWRGTSANCSWSLYPSSIARCEAACFILDIVSQFTAELPLPPLLNPKGRSYPIGTSTSAAAWELMQILTRNNQAHHLALFWQ